MSEAICLQEDCPKGIFTELPQTKYIGLAIQKQNRVREVLGRKAPIDLGERGKLSPYNSLNDLTGKEWIKFTKSWFIHRPPRRKNDEILHPAKYPETLVEEFIRFFTKKSAWVLDPFLGTGSTLIAAGNSNRNGVGIEIMNKYFNTSKKRIKEGKFKTELNPILGSSRI